MKNKIVFDSSTLILLAKISMLRSVTQRMRCIITDIVKNECVKKDTYDSKIIKELIKEEILEIVSAKPEEFARIKNDFNVQSGEASSLALAIRKKCFIGTDDGPAIKACTILNVDFATAIHFVVTSYKRGLLDRKSALEKMSELEKHGRYKTRIIEDAKQRIKGD